MKTKLKLFVIFFLSWNIIQAQDSKKYVYPNAGEWKQMKTHQEKINLFLIPTVEEITVEFKDTDSNLIENEVKNFEIFDEQGNFVKEITGNDSLMEKNKVKINTSDLKRGTYYLHFNAKNQDIKRHKIIID